MRNDLPAEVVTASSVKAFKNKLEAHLKTCLDGRQSNRNRMHRPCLCTCVSVGVFYKLLLKNCLFNRVQEYSAFANSCPLQTDTFLFPLIHSHNVIFSSNKF